MTQNCLYVSQDCTGLHWIARIARDCSRMRSFSRLHVIAHLARVCLRLLQGTGLSIMLGIASDCPILNGIATNCPRLPNKRQRFLLFESEITQLLISGKKDKTNRVRIADLIQDIFDDPSLVMDLRTNKKISVRQNIGYRNSSANGSKHFVGVLKFLKNTL